MATTDGTDTWTQARLAAGALFVRAGTGSDEVLLVHKTYGIGWDIPGGYVEPGESPAQACRREVAEELGIDRAPGRLLVHDWAPNPGEGDKVLYVFDGGRLDDRDIVLQTAELDSWEWVRADLLEERVVARLSRRLRCALVARAREVSLYLERGAVAPEAALPSR
ncbi:NUDIX domain-containing protein [Nocardia sienata]|uniref:NUDIX domain-containing protein n=1 Tax=Nocardia sienata TaxID=248552 RepID=UPI0007A3ACB3|nr:NUDIX hydrolase [Nocardia sienata]